MSEAKQAIKIFAVPVIIFFICFAWFSLEGWTEDGDGFSVSDYELEIYLEQDKMRAEETITYKVYERGFHELWRSYNEIGPAANLKFDSSKSHCPSGAFFKTADLYGKKEAICRMNAGYAPGTYTVHFAYEIPKPYKCYADVCELHWNVMDDFGSKIRGGEVRVHGDYDSFVSYPSGWEAAPDNYVLSDIQKQGLFEVRATLPREKYANGAFETYDYNAGEEIDSWMAYAFMMGFLDDWSWCCGSLFILAELMLVFGIYWVWGKEKPTPGVPDVLHYVPEKIEPWLVNYLYVGKVAAMDDNAVYATILSLATKGYIKTRKGELVVKKPADTKLTKFENNVMRFIEDYSVNGVFSKENFKKLVKKRSDARKAMTRQKEIRQPTKQAEELANKSFDLKGWVWTLRVGWIVAIPSLVLALVLAGVNNAASSVEWGILYTNLGLLIAVMSYDKYFFGRFSDTAIKKKREWGAFKNLLGNYSLIKKYAPEDTSMWQDWLVYATALGEADNVIKAMKDMHVEIPNIDDYHAPRYVWIATSTHATRTATPKSSSSSGFSAGGGVGGFGGGFGGGGGGAR